VSAGACVCNLIADALKVRGNGHPRQCNESWRSLGSSRIRRRSWLAVAMKSIR
jgi:hypothetical protein